MEGNIYECYQLSDAFYYFVYLRDFFHPSTKDLIGQLKWENPAMLHCSAIGDYILCTTGVPYMKVTPHAATAFVSLISCGKYLCAYISMRCIWFAPHPRLLIIGHARVLIIE